MCQSRYIRPITLNPWNLSHFLFSTYIWSQLFFNSVKPTITANVFKQECLLTQRILQTLLSFSWRVLEQYCLSASSRNYFASRENFQTIVVTIILHFILSNLVKMKYIVICLLNNNVIRHTVRNIFYVWLFKNEKFAILLLVIMSPNDILHLKMEDPY